MKKYNYSIIIPHYNSPELLGRMLNSIPERDDVEIIVIDDCSCSENVEKLRLLQHKNLQIIFLSTNCGAGYARNVGLEKFQGKWVNVVDADDMYTPDAFDVFDKYKDSDYDYICFRIEERDPDLKPLPTNVVSENSVRKYLNNPNNYNTKLLRYKNQVCRNKLVSGEFIRKYNIRCECSQVNNDVIFALGVGLHGEKVKVIPNILYYLVSSENSITRQARTMEKEFQFYLQAQKRNGLFKAIGLKKYPFYRYDFLYALHFLKKYGLIWTVIFFKYRKEHMAELDEAKVAYLPWLAEQIDIDKKLKF